MSVKIKLSYETDDELAKVYDRLIDYIQRVQLEPSKGRYKRAYITLKSIAKSAAKSS